MSSNLLPALLPCLRIELAESESLETQLRAAAAAGWTAIDLSLAHSGSNQDVAAIRSLTQELGLSVPLVHSLTRWMDSKDGPEKLSDFALCHSLLVKAAELGARFAIASPIPDTDELDTMRAAGRYRELLQYGKETGVRVVLEFIPGHHNLHTLEQAIMLVRAAEHRDACLAVDLSQPHLSALPLQIVTELPHSFIAVCQVRTMESSSDDLTQMQAILHELADRGWSGPISVPLALGGGQNAEEAARLALECAESLLER